MPGKIKPWQYIAVFLILLVSCDGIKEDLPPCEIELEFVFDYNMEYADAFNPQVKSVNVFVFDSNDIFLFSRNAMSAELTGGNRMSLTNDLQPGNYKVITVGGLSDQFRISDTEGQDFVPGITTIQQFMFALQRQSDRVDYEFPHLYFGEATAISYALNAGHKKYRINLMRDTNRFNIVLLNLDDNQDTDEIPFAFEIVSPENAGYSWENQPTDLTDPVTYTSYFTEKGQEEDVIMAARINTLRLLNRENLDYKFVMQNTNTGEKVVNVDLMTLLKYTKPASRPDDTELPLQEYLDRQSEWNLILCVKTGSDGMLGFGIKIGSWIYWLHDMGI